MQWKELLNAFFPGYGREGVEHLDWGLCILPVVYLMHRSSCIAIILAGNSWPESSCTCIAEHGDL